MRACRARTACMLPFHFLVTNFRLVLHEDIHVAHKKAGAFVLTVNEDHVRMRKQV